MTGTQTIPAPRQTVWEALNDPDVLKECIPGCEEIERTGDHGFTAKVSAKVGPVKAKFAGAVELQDLNPPESYTIVGEGKGGAAGFAKGGAKVHLEETTENGEPATILTYEVNANVGGKLAAIGSRLIDSTAKKYANDFFEKFKEIASNRAPSGGAAPTQAAETPPADAKPAGAQTAPAAPAPAAAAPAPVQSTPVTPAPAKKEDHAVAAASTNPNSDEMKRLGIPAENVYEGLHWAAGLAWVALAAAAIMLVVLANA
ncbi:carbon monoxide dehydrogenase subunit G [Thalassobaculum sp. OXR-137]|uniref:SRPBCC family protein n=1 Tax=Thalassobaculum sp. OXR-137 TaxID=3100173 RepID=UPI002AC921C4|nr:carbon monoxide dehydrogenase subunit G [Thalassobaculum sp. OXR-137]WPZ33056.1 carbon monoxide dehydrogenase subunit G [Thalassobaculum sp. OXR-137]